jgi:hypothetical protein
MSKKPEERYATAGEVGAAAIAALERPAAPARRMRPPPSPAVRRGPLIAALTDPFNIVLLAGLLVAGAVLGTVALMVPLALLVYAAGVVYSYRNSGDA